MFGTDCWSFGGDDEGYRGTQDQSDVETIVKAALDRGVNYFGTEEAYNEGGQCRDD